MTIPINYKILSQTLRNTAISAYKNKEDLEKTNISTLLWIAADCLDLDHSKNFNLTTKEFLEEENPKDANQYEIDFHQPKEDTTKDSNILIIKDDIDEKHLEKTDQRLLAENERQAGIIETLKTVIKNIEEKGTALPEAIKSLLNEENQKASSLNTETIPEQDFRIHENVSFSQPKDSGETLESAIVYSASLIEKKNAFRITKTQISDSAQEEMQNSLKTLLERLTAHFNNKD